MKFRQLELENERFYDFMDARVARHHVCSHEPCVQAAPDEQTLEGEHALASGRVLSRGDIGSRSAAGLK